MLMDNTLELLGITDSNIKITRFSAESVNGEKRSVIEARRPTMWTDAPTANQRQEFIHESTTAETQAVLIRNCTNLKKTQEKQTETKNSTPFLK